MAGACSAILRAKQSIGQSFDSACVSNTITDDVDKLRSFVLHLSQLFSWRDRRVGLHDLQIHAEILLLKLSLLANAPSLLGHHLARS